MQIQFHLSYNVYVTQTSQSVLSHNEFSLGRYSLIQDEEKDKEGVSIIHVDYLGALNNNFE